MSAIDPLAAAPDLTAHLLVSLIALGIGIAFLSADRQSPASRALAGGFELLLACDLVVGASADALVPPRAIT